MEFVRIKPNSRIVVWRGFYTASTPITSPYYEFKMYLTKDGKIYRTVLKQLATRNGRPEAKQ